MSIIERSNPFLAAAYPSALIDTARTGDTAQVAQPVNVTPNPARTRVIALERFAISITALTVLGHLFLGFEQSPIIPISAVVFAYVFDLGLEFLDSSARRRPARYGTSVRSVYTFLLPSHITALACSMLLFAGGVVWPYLLAVAAAVTSKHVVKVPVKGAWRHVLNPSNTGIVVVLLLFPWVGIAPPYEFTENVQQPIDWILPIVILVAGTMLNGKLTGRGPLILAWVGGFTAQALARSIFADHYFVAAITPMTGVAFILFTNYMVTDPGTTPSSRRGQIMFGLVCAFWYGALMSAHIVFGLFFALVLTCVTRGLWCYWHAWSHRSRADAKDAA